MADIQGFLRVLPSDGTTDTTITGANALKVDGSAVTQPVSGTVTVTQATASSLNAQVQGVAADGTAVTGNPVLLGGQDGTNVQSIFTDTTGRQVMVGAAADGAAFAGNPVLIAGQDGTNAQSIFTDTTGRQVMVGAAADGAAVTGNPVLISGTDGTNAQSISVDTAGRVNVNAVFGAVSTGTIAFYGTVAAVANNATGTITYTTSVGVTFFLKQIIASASGATKVVVDYGGGPTIVMTGFTSSAHQIVNITFDQPIPIAASTAVNVKITNRAGAAQDVYATILGLEV
jgi:NAD(P)H-dependent FMN reductase